MPATSARTQSRGRSQKPNVRVRPRSATLAGKSDRPVRRTKVWLAVLALWLAMLSGGAAPWTGPPGVLQQLRLHSLLGFRKAEQAELQDKIEKLRSEAGLLERSRAVQ